MARIITRERMNHRYNEESIPVWGYGIEADSYEEAYALAKRMFNEDYAREQEEQRERFNRFVEEWGVQDF